MEHVVQTKGLKKIFTSRERGKTKTVEAVSGVDLEISSGEIFGLLGPNGAGKTTIMRILCTLLTPTSGKVQVAGFDLVKNQEDIRRNIGYVGQKGGMEREATGRENLILQAEMYGMSKKEAEERSDELIKRLNLSEFSNRQTSKYSGGQKRIFDLATGVVNRPKVMFLDEPTTGLDPQTRISVWEEIKKLHDEGTTIVLTTHYMEEADAICNRVAIIDFGKIVTIGSPAELKRQISADIITLNFEKEEDVKKTADFLAGNTAIKEIKTKDNMLYLYVSDGSENLPGIMSSLDKEGIIIKSIQLTKPTLDDVFLKLTGRTIKESEE